MTLKRVVPGVCFDLANRKRRGRPSVEGGMSEEEGI